jgi:hypothetical protein
MSDLFGHYKIRTLGLYQPYASLMLHGKIESRWVEEGKKPPFPLGKYLIYSTKKSYSVESFKHLSGEYYQAARNIITREETSILNGYAICLGDLVKVEKIGMGQLPKAFVDVNLTMIKLAKPDIDFFNEIIIDDRQLWGLHFQNVQRIKPFPFRGKQGVGILSDIHKTFIQLK